MPDVQAGSARDHYLALLRDGEALNLTYGRLGDYIAQRLTAQELRELLRDHVDHQGARHYTGGSNDPVQ